MLRLVFLLVCVISLSLGKYPAVKFTKGGFLIGDLFYRVDNSKDRTQVEALAFCESIGGQLAILTGIRLYKIIQAAVPTTGGYWIDGLNTVGRFELTNNCTYDQLSFYGIPEENLDLSPVACLNFYKGANPTDSKIRLLNCNNVLKGVVCSVPLNGCWESTTSRTTPWGTTVAATTAAG